MKSLLTKIWFKIFPKPEITYILELIEESKKTNNYFKIAELYTQLHTIYAIKMTYGSHRDVQLNFMKSKYYDGQQKIYRQLAIDNRQEEHAK